MIEYYVGIKGSPGRTQQVGVSSFNHDEIADRVEYLNSATVNAGGERYFVAQRELTGYQNTPGWGMTIAIAIAAAAIFAALFFVAQWAGA